MDCASVQYQKQIQTQRNNCYILIEEFYVPVFFKNGFALP